MKKMIYMVFLAVLLVFSDCVLANNLNAAQVAKKSNLTAVTIYVDINGFSRKTKAAKKMTKMHLIFAKEGYELLSINVYTENGDLQGFFVSYQLK